MDKTKITVLRYGGLRPEDAPKFVDAYIIDAEHDDGTKLTLAELDEINDDYDFILNSISSIR